MMYNDIVVKRDYNTTARAAEDKKMAKAIVDVICKECGREFTHTHMCCDRKSADRYEKWASENVNVCPECYKKAQQNKYAEQINKITEEAKSSGLTELKGTEKQVKWAVEIRAKFFDTLKKMVKPTAIDKVVSVINNFDESTFWIENRHESVSVPKQFYLKMKKEVMNQEV